MRPLQAMHALRITSERATHADRRACHPCPRPLLGVPPTFESISANTGGPREEQKITMADWTKGTVPDAPRTFVAVANGIQCVLQHFSGNFVTDFTN